MSEMNESVNTTGQVATFAAGCFWGVEAAFRRLPGVVATAVGYAGGETEEPTYHQVCSGRTGHAEAVRIEFDPALVTFADLMRVFWDNHDPTTLNRQGPDIGTQYRSVAFFHSPEQETQLREALSRLESSGRFSRPIVTEILPAPTFHHAEEYHQQYLEKRGMASCHLPPRPE